jgi:D-3-phosphoglycerate dehydrogenase
MPEWKIVLTDGLHKEGLPILNAVAQVDDRDGIPAAELLGVIENYDAAIVRGRTKMTAEVFEAASRLKVIGRAGVGVDNIDLAAATAHGVTVVNAPLATTLAVAEHTLALMLSVARSIPHADEGLKSGQWLKNELEGVELMGKTLGVIGIGHIGRAVAQRAIALGMTVLAYDPVVPEDEIRGLGASPVHLLELYERSDFLTLHVPLTLETRHMINGQALGHMKRGVRIICASRGGIIDETAMLGALESGQVAGAGLDVFAKEPPGMSALVTHPNVVATPHIGAQTREAQARTAVDIASEVLAALRGEALRWKIV